MSPSVATAETDAAPAGAVLGFHEIAIAWVVESPLNPRTHFDQAKLEELAQSIREKGIIEPLVVRPHEAFTRIQGRPFYEIVAGARRYRASQLAGLERVPCIVRELADVDALEMMTIENGQREDVDALDEARGYRALLGFAPGQFSAASIAQKIGRSEKFVWDRLKLLDLVPEAQQLLERGLITAGHGILLARLTPEQQDRAIDPKNRRALWRHEDTLPLTHDDDPDRQTDAYAGVKAVSVRELEAWIATHIRFNPVQMAAAAPLDFGETATKIEEAQQRQGRGKKVVAITHEYRVSDDARDEKERTYGRQSWKRADGSSTQGEGALCECSVLGTVVAGPEYGTAFEVCVNKDKCEVHWKAEIKARAKAAKERAKTPAGKAAAAKEPKEQPWEIENRKREAEQLRFQAAAPALVEAFAAVISKKSWKPLSVFLLEVHDGASQEDYAAATAAYGAVKTAEDFVRVLALACVLTDVNNKYRSPQWTPKHGKSFGVDVAAIVKAANVQTSAVAAPAKAAKKKRRAA